MTDYTREQIEGMQDRRFRHLKRGSTYVAVGTAKVQTDTPLTDYAEVVVYRAEDGGALWVRPVAEFEDGRFKEIEAAAPDLARQLVATMRRVAELEGALEVFASDRNWNLGGPCDPNSPSFVGTAIARAALGKAP